MFSNSNNAKQRLAKEYKILLQNPTPFIIARPNERNLLQWHYIITGPPETPYENGQYHGILTFTDKYPFAGPSISICTPNGRFLCGQRICLSMSDYHPEEWNPTWGVLTILNGFLSFFTGNENALGCTASTEDYKKRCARGSRAFNNNDKEFQAVFPEIYASNNIEIQQNPQCTSM